MLERPLVSIVIFTYNHEMFIRETLEGAINQTYKNIEIIVADDCSTDNNIKIIMEYVEKYPKLIVPVIGQKNEGITKNANRGMAACKGEYIAMVGGDDVIFHEKIEKQIEWFMADDKRALCGHGLQICNEKTEVISAYKHRLPKHGFGRKNWLRYGPLFGATSVVIKSKYLPTPVYDERVPIVSDWKLYVDVLEDDLEYGYIPEVLGLYRKHSSNVTNNVKKAIDDLDSCINIFLTDFPTYRNDIRLGKSYLVYYGLGNYYSNSNDYRNAIKWYLNALATDSRNWKAYLKLILCLKYFLNLK